MSKQPQASLATPDAHHFSCELWVRRALEATASLRWGTAAGSQVGTDAARAASYLAGDSINRVFKPNEFSR